VLDEVAEFKEMVEHLSFENQRITQELDDLESHKQLLQEEKDNLSLKIV